MYGRQGHSPAWHCVPLLRITSCMISVHIKNWHLFSLRLDLSIEVNCLFLEKEYRDLSIFSVGLN